MIDHSRLPKIVSVRVQKACNLFIPSNSDGKIKKHHNKWKVHFIGGKKKMHTDSIKDKTGNPVWETEVTIKIVNPQEPLVLLITDSDDHHVGQVVVPLVKLQLRPENPTQTPTSQSRLCISELEPTRKVSQTQGTLYYWAWIEKYRTDDDGQSYKSSLLSSSRLHLGRHSRLAKDNQSDLMSARGSVMSMFAESEKTEKPWYKKNPAKRIIKAASIRAHKNQPHGVSNPVNAIYQNTEDVQSCNDFDGSVLGTNLDIATDELDPTGSPISSMGSFKPVKTFNPLQESPTLSTSSNLKRPGNNRRIVNPPNTITSHAQRLPTKQESPSLSSASKLKPIASQRPIVTPPSKIAVRGQHYPMRPAAPRDSAKARPADIEVDSDVDNIPATRIDAVSPEETVTSLKKIQKLNEPAGSPHLIKITPKIIPESRTEPVSNLLEEEASSTASLSQEDSPPPDPPNTTRGQFWATTVEKKHKDEAHDEPEEAPRLLTLNPTSGPANGQFDVRILASGLTESVIQYALFLVDGYVLPAGQWKVVTGKWSDLPEATHCLTITMPPMPVGEVYIDLETLSFGRLRCPLPFVYEKLICPQQDSDMQIAKESSELSQSPTDSGLPNGTPAASISLERSHYKESVQVVVPGPIPSPISASERQDAASILDSDYDAGPIECPLGSNHKDSVFMTPLKLRVEEESKDNPPDTSKEYVNLCKKLKDAEAKISDLQGELEAKSADIDHLSKQLCKLQVKLLEDGQIHYLQIL